MASNVCLTKKQAAFFKYITEYKKKNGYYPGLSQAATDLNRSPQNITCFYGTLFLRGAFTDGRAQSQYHADSHYRSDLLKDNAAKARAAKKPAQKKPEQKKSVPAGRKQIAALLVKLLAGEDMGQDLDALSSPDGDEAFKLFRKAIGL